MYKESAVILLFLLKSALSVDLYGFNTEATGQSITVLGGNDAASRIFSIQGDYRFFDELPLLRRMVVSYLA